MKAVSIEDLVEIGLIGKPHGISGELNVRLTIDTPSFADFFDQGKCFVFVHIDNLPVPMHVEAWRTKGPEGLLLQLKRINTREKALELQGCPLLIDSCYLNDIVQFTPEHFIGFTLYNQAGQLVGKVIEVNDTTANILFSVETPSLKVLLIPIADDLVQSVDALSKEIYVSIPEGLMEL